jgi:hypothetical protein
MNVNEKSCRNCVVLKAQLEQQEAIVAKYLKIVQSQSELIQDLQNKSSTVGTSPKSSPRKQYPTNYTNYTNYNGWDMTTTSNDPNNKKTRGGRFFFFFYFTTVNLNFDFLLKRILTKRLPRFYRLYYK